MSADNNDPKEFLNNTSAPLREVPSPEEIAAVPDPAGPPLPVAVSIMESVCSVALTGTIVTGIFLAGAVVSAPCLGATRSSRLKWAERDAVINAALADQQALEAEPAKPATDDNDRPSASSGSAT